MLSSSFQGLKNVVVVVYGTTKGDVGERDFGMICTGLWIKVGNGYILCILEDMSGFVGGKVRLGITGGFGILEENDNGMRVIDFCSERGLCVGNTCFKHKSLHDYTRVTRPRWS